MTTYGDMLFHLGGAPVIAGQDMSGTTYFVDNNFGNDGNTGLSWPDGAFKTLSRATTVSNARIASGQGRAAHRNTIYFVGDRLVEDLLLLPDKADIIGVGSCDGFKGGCLEGDHAIAAGTGTRLFNMGFEPGTAADIFTLTGGSFIQFHNCQFRSTRGGSTAVSAIDTTAVQGLVVNNCQFQGAFTGDVIDIGAGSVDFMEITGNKILGGANDGIIVTGTTTITGGTMAIISDNNIYVNNVTINDGADSTIVVQDNTLATAANFGATSHVITSSFGANNLVSAANGVEYVPQHTDIEA